MSVSETRTISRQISMDGSELTHIKSIIDNEEDGLDQDTRNRKLQM
jgi:hypothetical protein